MSLCASPALGGVPPLRKREPSALLFNTWTFLAFFLLVFALYVRAPLKPQNVLLLVASYVFYGWWDWLFLTLIWVSTAVDFLVARRIEDLRNRGATHAKLRQWLTVSLATNLGILGCFKYNDFFVASWVDALALVGVEASPSTLNIILPVGISFYTFQTMAYTIDVFRGRLAACRSLLLFSLYVCYFPQLVAGPIERPGALLPQLANKRRLTLQKFYSGTHLFFIGFVKKVGIADLVAPEVDRIFTTADTLDSGSLLLGVALFAVQIYADFSGYSAMARGISRALGIELCENFTQPYFSTHITEFWRRWHMSLSSWLRDYLYIELGGNRLGRWKTYRNLFLTMLLGGLWHGAGWKFVVWGGIHGIALAVHKAAAEFMRTDLKRDAQRRWRGTALPLSVIKWAFTMVVVLFAWIFFRAESFDKAWAYTQGIAAWTWPDAPPVVTTLGEQVAAWADGPACLLLATWLWILVIDIPLYRPQSQTAWLDQPAWVRGVFYAASLLIIALTGTGEQNNAFIYFQF